ncbi:hypothetical protein [Kribbella deserti]|uniref:PRC-barrel domain containing protein n=1 Tax=Kribbella deserti TaxID=1926257 RepID=A0ABV6QG65_9ACTN
MGQIRVADLVVGQVISSDARGLAPAQIVSINSVGDRQLQLVDLSRGERLPRMLRLAEDELVEVHDIKVEHRTYTNITNEEMVVALGPETFTVPPGGTLHHRGRERPDVFDPACWRLDSTC